MPRFGWKLKDTLLFVLVTLVIWPLLVAGAIISCLGKKDELCR
jgi:hypothetical protein